MTSHQVWPISVRGVRHRLGAEVSQGVIGPGAHSLWVALDKDTLVRDLPIPPEGLAFPVDVDGVMVVIRVSKARAHLLSLELA